jgi:ankyrin repeat protein
MKILAEAGANVFQVHKKTKANALHVAIQRKHFNIAEILIKSNFPVNEGNKGGVTPLMLAAIIHSPMNIGQLLLKFKANVNQTDHTGMSALAYCVQHENLELGKFLIQKGKADLFNSNIEIRDSSPFFVAINQQYLEAIELFCDSGANI